MHLVRLLVLPALVFASKADAATLRLYPPKNQVYRYAVSVSMESRGSASGKVTQSALLTTRVLNTGASVLLSNSITDVKVEVPSTSPLRHKTGQLAKGMLAPNIELSLDSRGKATSMRGANSAVLKSFCTSLGQTFPGMVLLPQGTFKVGMAWSTPILVGKVLSGSAPGMAGSTAKLPLAMKVVAIETKNGKKAARIKMSLKGTVKATMKAKQATGESTIHVRSEGQSWIDLRTGMPVESYGAIVVSSAFGKQTATQTSKASMRLL